MPPPVTTEALCYRDAYARSTDGHVTRSETGDGGTALVALERTVFYPGGGGQPADQGWLVADDGRRWAVRSARRDGEDIVHELRSDDGAGLPAPGERLVAELDWSRRHQLMRTHTALHALCGVVFRDHGALVTGGNMEPGRGRMDFEFESLSAELAARIEQAVNVELLAARPVHVRFLTLEQAASTPDLIRTRTNLLPTGIAEVRVIDIEGLDMQADGGTHVANTREVGTIRITGTESKGRINKRIRLELVDPDQG